MSELKGLPSEGGPSATLTVRLLMQGKEVGSIIGKKGEIVKRFREEVPDVISYPPLLNIRYRSGAKINISDGSCPERIVTVTGSTDAIFKSFQLITKKLEEVMERNQNEYGGGSGGTGKQPIQMRVIVPASQCGSLIGKGGSKIKEIREVTGASIQVASEMLPNSTERAVTISGSCDALTQCIYHICCVMLESPPKGATIPYRPKPQMGGGGPGMFGGNPPFGNQMGGGGYGGGGGGGYGGHDVSHDRHDSYEPAPNRFQQPKNNNPLAGLLSSLGGGGGGMGGPQNSLQASTSAVTALAALAGSQLRAPQGAGPNTQTHEITVPNELIGCIIGKGGTKIAEIRQLTGAMITITKFDDTTDDATHQERIITIKGNSDQVALAQYLINTSVEMHKANLEGAQGEGEEGGALNPSAIPLANLLKNPAALNALSALTNINMSSLGGLQELLGGNGSVQTTGVHKKSYAPRGMRAPPGGSSPPRDQKRNKFQPY